jgi:hypothetical protein
VYDTNFCGVTDIMRETIRIIREINGAPREILLNISSKARIEAPAGIRFYSSPNTVSDRDLLCAEEDLHAGVPAKELDPVKICPARTDRPGDFRQIPSSWKASE